MQDDFCIFVQNFFFWQAECSFWYIFLINEELVATLLNLPGVQADRRFVYDTKTEA